MKIQLELDETTEDEIAIFVLKDIIASLKERKEEKSDEELDDIKALKRAIKIIKY